jgi:hypothetical protein
MEVLLDQKTYLSQEEYEQKALQLKKKVDDSLSDFLKRRSRQEKQPILDFLFEYYKFRPGKMGRYSPGASVIVQSELSPEDHSWTKTVDGWQLDTSELHEKRLQSLNWVLTLVEATQDRKPHIGCMGMHEWAMVYKTEQPRHPYLDYRVPVEEINKFVESRTITCSHFDAFRFFTEEARPLNKIQPERDKMIDLEQPGCLHTNMDIYRWAYKFYPFVSSELIWDAFQLTRDIRMIDMLASPYDMSSYGYEPVRVETVEGQQKYMRYQQEFYERGKPLRKRLIDELKFLAD